MDNVGESEEKKQINNKHSVADAIICYPSSLQKKTYEPSAQRINVRNLVFLLGKACIAFVTWLMDKTNWILFQ